MNRHEKHHLAKEHERDEKNKEHAAYVLRHQRRDLPPGWLVGAGLLITLLAVLLWTFIEW